MDFVTLSVTPIVLKRVESDGSSPASAVGTAFFWRRNSQWFLVTNWHNVTGINPDTLGHIGTFTPTHCEISLKYTRPSISGRSFIANQSHTFPLYVGDRPIWLEHSAGREVDCVALPLEIPSENEFAGRAANEIDATDSYIPSVGDDCFVIGYPRGLMSQGRTPIWKRASIASEPELNHGDRPVVLVDTATREGMSGSLVIARHSGLHNPSGILDGSAIIGTVQCILGIYSGRIGDDELGVQLGRVWKRSVVEELFVAGVPGVNPIDVKYGSKSSMSTE